MVTYHITSHIWHSEKDKTGKKKTDQWLAETGVGEATDYKWKQGNFWKDDGSILYFNCDGG